MASTSTAKLAALLRATIIDDDAILQITNTLPEFSQKNSQALHARAVALLKLDRFDDALRTLDGGAQELSRRCALEKAYALYKLGRLSDAAKTANEAEPKSRGLKHVAAQVSYRDEEFENTVKLYGELSLDHTDITGEENDLKVNISAVYAQLWWQGKRHWLASPRNEPEIGDLDAFETTYNIACSCIARREFEQARALLGRARDLCEASEDLTDEEKRAELLPIMVQQAFVFSKLGNTNARDSLHRTISLHDVPEAPTRAVALNNVVAASIESDNPFMTIRTLGRSSLLSHAEQHFKHQRVTLRHNEYVLDLQSQKHTGLVKITNSLVTKLEASSLSSPVSILSVFNVAASAYGEGYRVALKRAVNLLAKRPKDLGLQLTIVQLHIEGGNNAIALATLEAYFKRLETSNSAGDQETRFAPGLVALATSLKRSLGRKSAATSELSMAASYWKLKPEASNELLRAAGVGLLKSAASVDHHVAGEIFRNVRQQNPNDLIAIAGFVASRALKNLSSISSDLGRLKHVPDLIFGIDADVLEDAGISIPVNRSVVTTTNIKHTIDAGKDTPAKKQRLRASRMPRKYEQGKQMDQERWIPMRDRSTYRPKKGKGKKKTIDMTQGGAVKEEESLELIGGAGTVRVERLSSSGGKPKKKKGKK